MWKLAFASALSFALPIACVLAAVAVQVRPFVSPALLGLVLLLALALPFRRVGLRAFAFVVISATAAGAAYAADAGTAISVGPFYLLAEPYILTAFGAVVTAAIGWIAVQVQKRTGIVATDSAKSAVQQAATNAAGRVLASLEPSAMGMKIDVHSPLIAAQVPHLQEAVGGAIDMLGMTPERVTNLIAGKIGILQAAGTPIAASTAVGPAA